MDGKKADWRRKQQEMDCEKELKKEFAYTARLTERTVGTHHCKRSAFPYPARDSGWLLVGVGFGFVFVFR